MTCPAINYDWRKIMKTTMLKFEIYGKESKPIEVRGSHLGEK